MLLSTEIKQLIIFIKINLNRKGISCSTQDVSQGKNCLMENGKFLGVSLWEYSVMYRLYTEN